MPRKPREEVQPLTDPETGETEWSNEEAAIQAQQAVEQVMAEDQAAAQAGIQIAGELGAEPAPAAMPVKSRNKVLVPVPVDMLGDAEDVPEDEWVTAPLSVPEERDAAQVKIDADVKDAYDKWVAAGKPHAARSPRKRRVVAPEHGPAVRHMIGSAGRLHKVNVVLAPTAHDKDGREVIVFSVRDRVQKTRKASDDIQIIRAWANANGFEVSERGRIPEDVRAAYGKAHAEASGDADAKADNGISGNESADALTLDDLNQTEG